MTDLRMNAYYYAFDATGVREIDLILSEVATAGKAYHHTESWTDPSKYNDPDSESYIDLIQQAAKDAAAEVRRLRAIVDAVDKLHEPTGTHMVAEIDGLTGEQREIEADSFEEITSRQVVCMSCAGYPEAPCATLRALDGHERATA